MTSSKIAVILPPREGFSPQSFGAISLSVRDFIIHSRYQHAITVFGSGTEKAFADTHYQPLGVKRRWYEPNTRAYVRAAMHEIRKMAPALIEVHNRPSVARALSKHTTIPIALHLHNDPQEMKYAKTSQQRSKLLNQCAHIYCVSEWAKTRFMEGLNETDEKRVHVMYSGLEIPKTIPAKEPYILYVGRMTPNKGVLEYAQALALTLPQHPDWKGVLIGGRRHSASNLLSDYEQNILNTIEPLNNAFHQGFMEHDKTIAFFERAEIVVIPSLWEEPYGRIAVEAIAHGCAVITSGSGGLKEIIGDAGIILQHTTAQEIAQHLQHLMMQPDVLRELQHKARARAELFDVSHCTQQLDRLRDSFLQKEPMHHAA